MNKLRFEQWKNEPADIFVLRVFTKALPHLDELALNALRQYIWHRSEAEVLKRCDAERESRK